MDIVSQALLGATLAQSVARKSEIKYATVIGALAGVLADADIFIQSSTDSLLTIEFHRHFTHSLLFIPVGALIATLLLWPIFKKWLPFGRIYVYALLGYSMSGFLDACTSYGTHLLWPLSDERIAWNIISIVDPVFTLSLLIAVIFSLRRQSFNPARIGLGIAAAYLLVGVAQLHRAEGAAEALAISRGHQPEQLVVKPTIANVVLWRSIYKADGYYYVDAIRIGTGKPKLYQGNSIPNFELSMLFPIPARDSVLINDIHRFENFSEGYIALHPEHKNIVGDVRYAMLPTSVVPLWGIEFDVDRPQQHAEFKFYRSMTATERDLFISMLFGK